MKIEYLHASKFSNGTMVAEEFKQQMATRGVTVDVHHIREITPKTLPSADLHVFSSPGRMGRPIPGDAPILERRDAARGHEVRASDHRDGTAAGQEDRTDADRGGDLQVPARAPDHDEALQRKGLVKVAEDKIYVTDLKGPLKRDGGGRSPPT